MQTLRGQDGPEVDTWENNPGTYASIATNNKYQYTNSIAWAIQKENQLTSIKPVVRGIPQRYRNAKSLRRSGTKASGEPFYGMWNQSDHN